MNKAAASVGQPWSGPRLAMMVWLLGPGACALLFVSGPRTLLDDAQLPCLVFFYCAALAIQLLMLGCQPYFRCVEGWCMFAWFPMVAFTLISVPFSVRIGDPEELAQRNQPPVEILAWWTLAITVAPPLIYGLRLLARQRR